MFVLFKTKPKMQDMPTASVYKVAVAKPAKPSLFGRIKEMTVSKVARLTAVATSSLMVANAHAAELNLSELTTQFEQVKTTVGGVITAAIGVTVLIVGWRWVKRAVFSV